MKYHLISLGCQMNLSDSERVRTVLQRHGFEETELEEEANILGVMACSVRQKAIDRIYSLAHKWNKWKNRKSLITFVSGCILPVDRDKFLKKFDLLFSINELPQLQDMLQQYGIHTQIGLASESVQANLLSLEGHFASTNNAKLKEEKLYSSASSLSTRRTDTSQETPVEGATFDIAKGFWKIEPSYSSKFEAFVTIQNGCDKFCTFCAVPYTRGREVSRASSEILQEVYELMQKGYKSITLLGQNVNSYGLDTNGKELSFAQLLERIGNMATELQHECWVYFTSPHPRDMTLEVLETVAKYPALAKQINLPLQSGDDKLLMRMNRNHSMTRYDQVVQDVRAVLPNATLFTDIIVGFCGETEEQFENTKKAMELYKYNMAYIAMYSPRLGAASSRWKDDVPHEIKKERFKALSKVLGRTSKAYNDTQVGKELKVLVDNVNIKMAETGNQEIGNQEIGTKAKDSNFHVVTLSARTEGKIPVRIDVDSSLYAQTNFEQRITKLVGNFLSVPVTSTHSLSLVCTLKTLDEGSK